MHFKNEKISYYQDKLGIMKFHLIVLFLLICGQGFCQTNSTKSDNYSSVSLAKDDPKFLALKDTEQAHLQIFIDSLALHGLDSANYRFGVKSDFVEKDDHEHMWSDVMSYDGKDFKGFFIDSAFVIKNIKTGDKVIINPKDIEDWSIYNLLTGKTTGNYSEMYLKEKEK